MDLTGAGENLTAASCRFDDETLRFNNKEYLEQLE
jgi:hypothetical protein